MAISVKEAVRIAQSNNFMGLICNARLLVRYNPTTSFAFSLSMQLTCLTRRTQSRH